VERDALRNELLAGRVGLPEAVGRMTEVLEEHRGRLSDRGQAVWPLPDRSAAVAGFLVDYCAAAPRWLARPVVVGELREDLARIYSPARTAAGAGVELAVGGAAAETGGDGAQ
jgi:hypothetical protein